MRLTRLAVAVTSLFVTAAGLAPGCVDDTVRELASCGDGTCEPAEIGDCAEDCGSSDGEPRCGDGVCDAPEIGQCVGDCGAPCDRDGVCDAGEVGACADCGFAASCGDGW